MSVPIPHASAQREALLAGQHRDAGGLVKWAKELAAAAVETAGVQCELRVGGPQEEWSLQVAADGRPVVLIDCGMSLDKGSLDRMELRATDTWRRLTRHTASFEPRPWGAVRVVDGADVDARGAERLAQLVASRTIDAACVVAGDPSRSQVRSPNPALSIESFQAALVGRCLVLAAGSAAAP